MLTRTGWWAAATAAFLVGAHLLVGGVVLLAIAATLVVALLVGLATVLRRPEVSAYQSLSPAVVGVGDRATALVRAANRGRRTTPPLVASDLIDGVSHAVPLPSLAPGETTTAQLALSTERRGVFTVGPLQIDLRDPFGLFAVTTHRGSQVSLTVHPEIHHMAPLPTGHRRELEGVTTNRPQEGGISFHSLREYVPGDDLRLVHWRSVARQPDGELMVRKNVVTSEPRLMVVLDTSADPYDDESFEDAVRLAASLVVAGCESRYPVMLRTTAGQGVDVGPSGDRRQDALTLLAGVTRSSDDPGLNGVVRFAERVEGVSLGAVTGQPQPDRTVGITRSRPRFDMVTVIQVGESFDRPPMQIPGALVVNGADSAQVASRWQARFGR